MIVQKAVELARVTDTVLVSDDIDLLVLLSHYACMKSHNICFKPEPMKGTKKLRVWNICTVKEKLGPDICKKIHFVFACYTWMLHDITANGCCKISQFLCIFSNTRVEM